MKKISSYSCVLVMLAAAFACNDKEKITIFYVENFYTTTPFRIKCNNFISYFGEDVKKRNVIISNKDFLQILSKLEPELPDYSVDTRCQIILARGDTLCMDAFHIVIGGKVYKNSAQLVDLICVKK